MHPTVPDPSSSHLGYQGTGPDRERYLPVGASAPANAIRTMIATGCAGNPLCGRPDGGILRDVELDEGDAEFAGSLLAARDVPCRQVDGVSGRNELAGGFIPQSLICARYECGCHGSSLRLNPS